MRLAKGAEMKRSVLGAVLVSAAMVLLSGCDSKAPSIVPAAGRITRGDGTPLRNVRVDFLPVEKPKSFVTFPYALTNDKGEFELVMLDPKQPGAPPGKYRVTVNEIPKPTSPTVPEKYTSSQTTPLEVTIPSGGSRDIRLQVDN
jgi:hypothetical protein